MSFLKSVETTITPYNKKLLWSGIGGALFILVSLPQTYTQTGRLTTTSYYNCPTPEGKFIHSGLFFAVNYFAMKLAASQGWLGMEGKSDSLMAKYSLYGTLLYFFLSSSDTYALTNNLIGNTANEGGCPEVKGIMIHGLVYLLLVMFMMYLPKDM